MESELSSRYNADQRLVIEEYWETIRFTRRTCKVADGVRDKEMTYWARFPVEIVIQALRIHISKYSNLREQYTRGIIRNLAREGSYGQGTKGKQGAKHERNARAADAFRSRFI